MSTNEHARSVYVASDGSGLHKIGMSVDPESRCRELTRGLGRPIEMLFSTQISHRGRMIERMSHEDLADQHRGNEWFSVSAEVAISTVNNAFIKAKGGEHGKRAIPLDKDPKSELQRRVKAAGLKQKDFAALLGVTENTMSRQLRGQWDSGTPRYVISILTAYELLDKENRMRWLAELNDWQQ